MQLLTNELGQQVDVLQEFKNFALPAGGMHRKPAFTLQFFHQVLQA